MWCRQPIFPAIALLFVLSASAASIASPFPAALRGHTARDDGLQTSRYFSTDPEASWLSKHLEPRQPEKTEAARTSVKRSSTATDAVAMESGSPNNLISNDTPEYAGLGLPLDPKLTPGIGLAGVLLMLAGMSMALVGIKVQRLQIFLSTSFLCSLGVTVLVVYVMNPPIPKAIEGAYVTAAVVVGVFAGGLAIVFPEVTEGLGCLLGGFCVSMWFLVLKPGGVIRETYGKIIMIAVCCLALFCLSFHQRSRPYALIFSLAFSGSTATVLGIDCFSRAGLKEFWLYVWDLNERIFPLHTYTYPHTRGVRVEIAVIILLTAMGIMSQVKLWKIIKERRNAKEALKRQQDADLEAQDEAVGRRVEEECQVERAQWEERYGDKDRQRRGSVDDRDSSRPTSISDSGLGGSDEKRSSVEEFVETENMKRIKDEHVRRAREEQEVSEAREESEQKAVTSSKEVAEIAGHTPVPQVVEEPCEDGVAPAMDDETRFSFTKTPECISRPHSQELQPEKLASDTLLEPETRGLPITPTPKIIPLPIPILSESDFETESEKSSVAACGEEEFLLESPRVIGRNSMERPLPRRFEEDKASTNAATCEEEDAGSTEQNFPEAEETETAMPGPAEPTVDNAQATDEPSSSNPSSRPSSEHLNSPKSPGQTSGMTSPQSLASKNSFFTPARKPVMMGMVLPADLAPASAPKAPSSRPPSVNIAAIQTHLTKAHRSARTWEWAKHVVDADEPELDVDIETDWEEEPAPVHYHELQETAEVKPKIATQKSKLSLHERSSSYGSNSQASFSEDIPPIPPLPSLPETSTAPRSYGESHRGDGTRPSVHERTASAASLYNNSLNNHPFLPGPTLMGHRDNIVRTRASMNVLDHARPLKSPIPSSRSGEIPRAPSSMSMLNPAATRSRNSLKKSRHDSSSAQSSSPEGTLLISNGISQLPPPRLNDDMPLRQRRSELQMLQHSLSRQSLNLTQFPVPPPRGNMLQTWRESIAAENQSTIKASQVDNRRQEMLKQRSRAAMLEKRKKDETSFRDEIVDERMRQADMLQLHQEAIRRMQAKANHKTP